MAIKKIKNNTYYRIISEKEAIDKVRKCYRITIAKATEKVSRFNNYHFYPYCLSISHFFTSNFNRKVFVRFENVPSGVVDLENLSENTGKILFSSKKGTYVFKTSLDLRSFSNFSREDKKQFMELLNQVDPEQFELPF